ATVFATPLHAHEPRPVRPVKAEHAELMQLPPHVTTTHFRFFGLPDVHSTLEKLAAVAEERFQHLCRPLNACERLKKPIDIWVADDAESFAAVFPDENPMSEWAAGVAFLKAQRVVLRAHGTALFSLMETFDHELAHILHHTFVPDHTGHTGQAGRALPRWYAEGLAIWQAGESVIDRLDAAVKAAASGNLLTFEELTQRFPNEGSRVAVGYAQSALFVRRLVKHHGVQPVVALLHDVSTGEPFDAAFERRFGSPPGVLFEELSDALEEASNPFVFLYDGNFLWGATTVLFLFVAWMKVRDRKRQLQRLAESEADRIANEDIALYLEREERERLAAQRRAETPDKPDPTLLN
ncbi:MAG TPA: peptidase MA family metallohydrolase, partial [Myxococcota bacterium]|nr:peptidase MA family metallohydrolase [Myxococcota bacterium]